MAYDVVHSVFKEILSKNHQEHPYDQMIPKPLESPESLSASTPHNSLRYTPSTVCILVRYHDPIKNAPPLLELVLTLRKENLRHGGQISFAGGKVDPGEDSKVAVLRELEEELGIPSKDITLAGKLPDFYLHHSRHQITPHVGIIPSRLPLIPNPEEVEEILSMPIEHFTKQSNQKESLWELRNHRYKVPFYDVHKTPLWGATAMMLAEWLKVYSEFTTTLKRENLFS